MGTRPDFQEAKGKIRSRLLSTAFGEYVGHQAEDTDLYKVDYREDFVDLGCWSRLQRSPSPRGDNGIGLQVDKPSTLLSHKWQTLNAKPLALLKAWSFRCGRRGFVPLLSALEGGSARVSVCLRIITHTHTKPESQT